MMKYPKHFFFTVFSARDEVEKYARFVCFAIFLGKLLSSVIPNWADSALTGCNDYYIHGYATCPPLIQQTFAIPYGLLWSLLNPIQYYGIIYQLYCVGFDFGTFAIQWNISKIPRRYLMYHQLITITAYIGAGHEYQNITIISLMPFAWLGFSKGNWIKRHLGYVVFGGIALAQKLPIDLNWRAKLQCLTECTNPYHLPTIIFTIPNGWSLSIPAYIPGGALFEPGHLSNYVCLGICFLLPWHYKRVIARRKI